MFVRVVDGNVVHWIAKDQIASISHTTDNSGTAIAISTSGGHKIALYDSEAQQSLLDQLGLGA
jgi:hypothetical protein